MIQNILTFCVKNDLTFVEGSLPSGKLVANDVNRNSIYLITPYSEAVVKANFQTNLQSDTPTSVIGILVDGKISVDELVDKDKSYYNLVKNWHIYEFKVPSTTLSFISRNRTGQIGINFSIEQRLVPKIKPTYGEFLGEIIDGNTSILVKDGYAINKTVGFVYDQNIEFGLNDLLLYNYTYDSATKISAYSNRGSTPTAMYSVDPSVLNDNFETIEPSLTEQIIEQVNDNTSDLVAINLTLNGVLDDIVDLENRISQAEQDIENLENTKVDNVVEDNDGDPFPERNAEIAAYREANVVKISARVRLSTYAPSKNMIKNSYVGDDSGIYVSEDDVNDTVKGAIVNNDRQLRDTVKAVVNEVGTTNTWQTNANVDSKITAHDNSNVAHLHLRTLINNLQKEIDRLNAKGRSWGEVDKTFSELWAMAEPTRSEYITDYLLIAFGDYIPTDGDLVYTKKSDIEEEHELEFNSALSQWVDNGAYIVSKASNTQMGLVQGDLTYVSILNGIIQVLKSDYATNVGSSGASYDYDDLLALFTEVANDIYKKNETYSATQIEQRITDLLGLANLQDTAIEKSAGVYDFDNGDSILASSLAQFNWVITRFYNVDGGVQNVRYNLFKPSEAVIGNRIIVQIDRSPVRYAEIKRDNGNILFRVVDESDDFDSDYVCTMKMWGIKLDGITANEVDYDNSTSGLVADKVQGAIDEVAFDLNTLKNKVDLDNVKQEIRINEIEELARKSASGEVSAVVSGADIINLPKNTANAPMNVNLEGGVLLEAPNLVVNGDFKTPITTGWATSNCSLSVIDGRLILSSNNVGLFSSTYNFSHTPNDTYYLCMDYTTMVDGSKTIGFYQADGSLIHAVGITTSSTPKFVSTIGQITYSGQMSVFVRLGNASASGNTATIDNVVLLNISQMKLKGIKDDDGVPFTLLTDEQIKTQLDLWVQKGVIPNDTKKFVSFNKRIRSVGKNLFDKDDIIPNKWLNNTTWQEETPSSNPQNYCVSKYIVLEPNTTYRLGNRNTSRTKLFDKDLQPIASVSFSGGMETFTTTSDTKYIRMTIAGSFSGGTRLNTLQLEKNTISTNYAPYTTSDLYLQANAIGYSLPSGVKDTIEYRNGKYYFVKRVDDTDINNLVQLSTYIETEIEAWGNLQGYENGVVYVDDIKFDADIYDNGVATQTPIKALESITKLVDGVETQLDINDATIALDKLSFTHTELNDGDIVWFTYEEDGNFYKGSTHITYYLDNMVRTSPDGSVWKLDWSVSNAGVVTWTPTKI